MSATHAMHTREGKASIARHTMARGKVCGAPLMQDLQKRLALHPGELGWIAHRAGVSRGAIRSWLRGDRAPSVDNLEALVNVIGYRLAIVPSADAPVSDNSPSCPLCGSGQRKTHT